MIHTRVRSSADGWMTVRDDLLCALDDSLYCPGVAATLLDLAADPHPDEEQRPVDEAP